MAERSRKRMKHKILSAACVVFSLVLFTACSGSKKESSQSSQASKSQKSDSAIVNYDEFEDLMKDTEDIDDGPLLSLSNTTAKPGELAKVTLSVKNADLKWNMCGIHITYPEFLKPDMKDPSPEVRDVKFETGDATIDNSGAFCKEWQSDLPDILTQKKLGCLFFTCMFSGDYGGDGEMFSVYLKVPENAEPGAVYHIGSYYMSTDLFSNMQSSMPFQKYAFSNFESGTITVE